MKHFLKQNIFKQYIIMLAVLTGMCLANFIEAQMIDVLIAAIIYVLTYKLSYLMFIVLCAITQTLDNYIRSIILIHIASYICVFITLCIPFVGSWLAYHLLGFQIKDIMVNILLCTGILFTALCNMAHDQSKAHSASVE